MRQVDRRVLQMEVALVVDDVLDGALLVGRVDHDPSPHPYPGAATLGAPFRDEYVI